MAAPRPPALAYDTWEATKATVHLTTQIMGKIQLARHPKLPHWGHATLRVTPRGVGTRAIPVGGGSFELELDVHDLRLIGRNSEGAVGGFALAGSSVADVYAQTMSLLDDVGRPTEILAHPYENPHSDTPFAEDRKHASWEHDAIVRWWEALSFVDDVFDTFAGRSPVRTSPVHLFWHGFDLAVTRSTGRRSSPLAQGERRPQVDTPPDEVVSFGWWPGDPQTRFPAFYSCTSPEPEGLAEHALAPAQAWWHELPGSHMAMLRWDDVRAADDPRATVLDFLESAWDAGRSALGLASEELRTEAHSHTLDPGFPGTRGREPR